MFGFTAQFCNNTSSNNTSSNNKNGHLFDWKSINELATSVRKNHKKLRVSDKFDEGLNGLNVLIKILFLNCKSLPLSDWIINHSFQPINNLIFGNIQSIFYPFIHNKYSHKLSLKTQIKKYQIFIKNIYDLCYKYNQIPLVIFSKNQRKLIYKLNEKLTKINNNISNTQKLTKLGNKSLESYLNSNKRIKRAEFVLKNRTDRILLILDGCYDIFNQMAMIRTAEIFGVQNIWIIRPEKYKNINISNRVSKSSQKWLTIKYFNSSKQCIETLKNNQKHRHRKIWVLDVGVNAMELSPNVIMKNYINNKNEFEEKEEKEYFAIVMGKESSGPSKEFLDISDKKIFLSQFGFCESFNVSVSCSIMLNNIFLMYPRMRGDMNENARNKLRYEWYYQLISDNEIQKQLDEYLEQENNELCITIPTASDD
eukprot:22981_1